MTIRKLQTNSISSAVSRRDFLRIGGTLIPAALIAPSLYSGSARAATSFDYYISPTGSDSNPGTLSSPWAITALNTKRSIYTGKTLGLLDGTYDVSSYIRAAGTSYSVAAFEVDGGTSSSPTVIAAVNARQAILDAKGSSGYYGGSASTQASILRHGASMPHQGNLVLDGIKFTNYKTGAVQIGTYGSSSNLQGIIVRNCEFTGQNGSGNAYLDNNYSLELNNGDGMQVSNNYFHDNVGFTVTSADHLSAILMWQCKNTIIEYNSCINSSNIYGKEIANQGTTIRYNYIESTKLAIGVSSLSDFCGAPTSGLTLKTSVHHNIIVSNAAGAPMTSTLANGGWTTGLDFYNNTIVLVNTGPILQQHFGAWFASSASGKLNFYNNLFAGDLSIDRKMISANAQAWGKCAYNMYPASGARWRMLQAGNSSADLGLADYSSLSSYRSAVQAGGGLSTSLMEQGTIESSLGVSSLFAQTGAQAAYYKLKSGSGAIGTGRSDGTSSGTPCDIGAWGNGATQIGCNFNAKYPSPPPVITVS